MDAHAYIARSTQLTSATLRRLPIPGQNPEDILVDSEGRAIVGSDDGKVFRIAADGENSEVLCDTTGRPLGLDFLPDGRLLICDAYRGMLAYDFANQKIEVLLHSIDGTPLGLCNNAAVATNGTIYFSESSTRHDYANALWDLIENIPSGRLIRFKPGSQPEVLLTDLPFPNGVAIAPDQSFIVYAESSRFRLMRYWLNGPNQGSTEIFTTLPGMPDNIAIGSDGLLWVAMPALGAAQFDAMQKLPRWLQWLLSKLAAALDTTPEHFGVMAFDMTATPVHQYCGESSLFRQPTGVREHGGSIFLGSIKEPCAAVVMVPPAPS